MARGTDCRGPAVAEQRAGHALKSTLRRVSFAALSLVLGLLGAEGVVRAYSRVGGPAGHALAERDPTALRFVPMGDTGYRQRPGAFQEYANGTRANWNAMGYRGPEVRRPKPPGTFRILLLGGSTSHGFGVNDDDTIDFHMREILRVRHPGRSIEVVNLSLGGYDSFQVSERMRIDGMALEPDVVVINVGINDVRSAPLADLESDPDLPDPRTLLWQDNMDRLREEARRGGPSLWTRLSHYSYLVRVPSYARSRLSIHPTVEKRRADPPRPEAIDYFAKNITRAAGFVREVDAGLILSSPPSALSTRHEPEDTSPRSYWIVDAATTEAYRRRLADRLERLAAELTVRGQDARYVSHDLDSELYLDDCHLTGAGNRAVAENLVQAIEASGRVPQELP